MPELVFEHGYRVCMCDTLVILKLPIQSRSLLRIYNSARCLQAAEYRQIFYKGCEG